METTGNSSEQLKMYVMHELQSYDNQLRHPAVVGSGEDLPARTIYKSEILIGDELDEVWQYDKVLTSSLGTTQAHTFDLLVDGMPLVIGGSGQARLVRTYEQVDEQERGTLEYFFTSSENAEEQGFINPRDTAEIHAKKIELGIIAEEDPKRSRLSGLFGLLRI